MKRSQLSPYVREVLSTCEVHLKSDELGLVAALLLQEVRLSSVVRSFVDTLTPGQRLDLLEYLQTGAFCGEYWVWQEPLKLAAADHPPPVAADPVRKGRKKKKGECADAEGNV